MPRSGMPYHVDDDNRIGSLVSARGSMTWQLISFDEIIVLGAFVLETLRRRAATSFFSTRRVTLKSFRPVHTLLFKLAFFSVFACSVKGILGA